MASMGNVSTPNIYTALDKALKLYNKNNDYQANILSSILSHSTI